MKKSDYKLFLISNLKWCLFWCFLWRSGALLSYDVLLNSKQIGMVVIFLPLLIFLCTLKISLKDRTYSMLKEKSLSAQFYLLLRLGVSLSCLWWFHFYLQPLGKFSGTFFYMAALCVILQFITVVLIEIYLLQKNFR